MTTRTWSGVSVQVGNEDDHDSRRAACPERRAHIPFVVAVSAVGQVVLDHASVRSVAYRLAPVSSVAPIRTSYNGLGHLGEWNVSPSRSSSDLDALLKIPTSLGVDEYCQQLTDRLVSIGVSSQRHVNLDPVAIATAFLVL